MHINDIFKKATSQNASDVHLKVGEYPMFRINGDLQVMESSSKMKLEEMNDIFNQVTNEDQREMFKNELELDLGYQADNLGRFRINIFLEEGTIGLACRPIKIEIPSLDSRVKIKIPSGTQPGDLIKLKAQGMPKLYDRGRGDMIVKIQVIVPKHLSRKQKKQIEQLDN